MITVTKKTALLLQESGYNVRCEFIYDFFTDNIVLTKEASYYDDPSSRCLAPTAEEIYEEIQQYIDINNIRYRLRVEKNPFVGKQVEVFYINTDTNRRDTIPISNYDHIGETLAEALAQMWIRCKKEGYLVSNDNDE